MVILYKIWHSSWHHANVLSFRRQVQEALTVRSKSGWKKFKDIAKV